MKSTVRNPNTERMMHSERRLLENIYGAWHCRQLSFVQAQRETGR